MKPKSLQGFTLIELIIVIAIIAVLAALAFMAMSGETAQARDSKRVSDLKTFEDSVSTSNGKNKKINYTTDAAGLDETGITRDDTQGDVLQTTLGSTSGALKAIRGANLVLVTEGMFDSDVLPTVSKDPKGSNYIGAFLSQTDYLFFATKENPDTKTPLALVRGTFSDGSVLDILNANLGGLTTSVVLSVANPSRFVRGDVIKVDDEMMAVVERNITNKTITVDRGLGISGATATLGGSSTTVHNKGASIKIMYPAKNANSLVCLGALADVIAGTPVPLTKAQASAASSAILNLPSTVTTLPAVSVASGATSAIVGEICNNTASSVDATKQAGYPVVDNGTNLPYKVN